MSHPCRTLGLALAAIMLFVAACGDDPRRPLNAACDGDGQCADGLQCIGGQCLDPQGDEDGDGLINSIEGALGTNAFDADSDGDGISDAIEVGDDLNAPQNSDGNETIDALESAAIDSDSDCIVDQDDPNNAVKEVDAETLGELLCTREAVGVCAAGGALGTCELVDGTPTLTCDFSAVADYEATEVSCDQLDNDCNGETDDRFKDSAFGWDGNGVAADAGKVLGDSCGVGACAGGSVVCGSTTTLTCSTSNQNSTEVCDGTDSDCNGIEDDAAPGAEGCSDFFVDADGDGAGDVSESMCLCAPSGNFTTDVGGDCNDGNADVAPGSTAAVCGADADCDGSPLDEGELCDTGNEVLVAQGCLDCGVNEFKVHASAGSFQGQHVMAALAGGDYVFAIQETQAPSPPVFNGASFGGDAGIHVQVMSPGSTYPCAAETELPCGAVGSFLLEPDTELTYDRMLVLPLQSGGFVVVTQAYAFLLESVVVQAQRFDAKAVPVGDPIDLSAGAPLDQVYTLEATALGGDDFLVGLQGFTWQTESEASFAIKIDGENAATVLGPALPPGTNAYTFSMIGADDGSYVVAWADYDFESGVQQIMLQPMMPNGEPNGEPTPAHDIDGFDRSSFVLTRGPGSSFTAVTSRYYEVGTILERQDFNADGTKIGAMTAVSEELDNVFGFSAAVAADGTLSVAWGTASDQRGGTSGASLEQGPWMLIAAPGETYTADPVVLPAIVSPSSPGIARVIAVGDEFITGWSAMGVDAIDVWNQRFDATSARLWR